MSRIDFTQLCKRYAPGLPLTINNANLVIDKGEFCVFVGPSGCGKSTLLRMVAGLEDITSGELKIEGLRVNDLPPAERGVAMVFQSYALYPHMTVGENMGFSLRLRNAPQSEIDRRVNDAAKILNLDAKLRVAMRAEIKALHQRLKTTTVYVTHDQIEAMTMADRIVVMHDGLVEQIGTPLELFDRPSNLFVAQFIGSPAMNVFSGTLRGDTVEALGTSWPLPPDAARAADGTGVHYGIRPTDLSLTPQGIAARVIVVEPTGAETELLVQVGDTKLVVVIHDRTDVQPDDTVYLAVDASKAHVFDSRSQQRL